MKLNLSPNRLFRSKKKISRSDPLSFGSSSSSDDSIDKSSSSAAPGNHTPTSVLPDFSSADLAQAFRLIDRDNDGVVSRHDLETLLTRLTSPLTPEEVAFMLSEVDAEGKGSITVEDLVNRVGSGSGSDPDELREAFDVFDTDGDGRISAEELLRVFQAIGDERCTLEECRRMIAGVDRNGDGFVCFEEFSRMMEVQQR